MKLIFLSKYSYESREATFSGIPLRKIWQYNVKNERKRKSDDFIRPMAAHHEGKTDNPLCTHRQIPHEQADSGKIQAQPECHP